MDPIMLRFMPRHIQELHNPNLKRRRIEKETKQRLVRQIVRELERLEPDNRRRVGLRQYHNRAAYAETHELNIMLEDLVTLAENHSANDRFSFLMTQLLRGHEPRLCQKVRRWPKDESHE